MKDLNNLVMIGKVVKKESLYKDFTFEDVIYRLYVNCNDEQYVVNVNETMYNNCEENDEIGIKANLSCKNDRILINAYKIYKI